jgi:hypothetical protein
MLRVSTSRARNCPRASVYQQLPLVCAWNNPEYGMCFPTFPPHWRAAYFVQMTACGIILFQGIEF